MIAAISYHNLKLSVIIRNNVFVLVLELKWYVQLILLYLSR